MTHSDNPHNMAPATAHVAEQMWAQAVEQLDQLVDYVRHLEPGFQAFVGGNTDASVTFDFMKDYIKRAEMAGAGHGTTIAIAAAAITRLVRAPRTENDDLAQLNTMWNNKGDKGNDDH